MPAAWSAKPEELPVIGLVWLLWRAAATGTGGASPTHGWVRSKRIRPAPGRCASHHLGQRFMVRLGLAAAARGLVRPRPIVFARLLRASA